MLRYRGTLKGERTLLLARIWRRLIDRGFGPTVIAKLWGYSPNYVSWVLPGAGAAYRRKVKQMRARVWSRLRATPFSMTGVDIAKIWNVSGSKVCQDVAELRYATPKLEAA